MALVVINAGEIPAGLAPGSYCCRLDESTTWAEFRVRFLTPPRVHEPGDCLVQVVKTPVTVPPSSPECSRWLCANCPGDGCGCACHPENADLYLALEADR